MSRLTIGLTFLAAVILQPGPARATFPGENGKFAVQIGSGPYRDQIVILNPDGSFSHYFPFFEDVRHTDPNWSPDGHLIAFGYHDGIAVAKPDGSDLVKLTDGSDEAPKWSPDQTSILFERFDFSYNTYDIYIMNADGSRQTNLTNNPAYDVGAQWAPNGTKIGFLRYVDQPSPQWHVYVMNPDGLGLARVTQGHAFSWAPNSEWIAFSFSARRRGQGDVYSVRPDGIGRRNLTEHPADDIAPLWGPNGRIAFASNRPSPPTHVCPDCNYDIYLMDSDGGNVTRLTNDPEVSIPLQWSPDGTQILFAQGDLYGSDLYVMNADGSGVFPLETRDHLNDATDWQPVLGSDGLPD